MYFKGRSARLVSPVAIQGKQHGIAVRNLKLPVGNLSQNVYYKAYLAMNLAASLVHAYHVLKALTGLTGYNLNCSRPPGVLTATRG